MGLTENSSRQPDLNQGEELNIYDGASLEKRLNIIEEELEVIGQNLFNEQTCREAQLQFEHRVILLGIFRRSRSHESMEEIYEKDPSIIEIRRFICDIAKKLEALSEIAWANRNRCEVPRP